MTSRVAKNPVVIPSGVDVSLQGQLLQVKGKLGSLELNVHPSVSIVHADSKLQLAPIAGADNANALSGTMRSLANNMVVGVVDGFEKKLTMVGVGYRAKAQGKALNISAGFSHPVDMVMPEGITAETPSNTEIIIKGIDKQAVCQVAANIRKVRPPEPYKGKGIRYHDEVVARKEGKKK
jgi:large subunit ribosomal protein L6